MDEVQTAPNRQFKDHLLWVLLALFCMWTIKIIEHSTEQSFSNWGLYPREVHGLWGLLTMPFLHGDFDHLFSNSFGVLALGLAVLHFYERVAFRVIFFSNFLANGLLWCFGRASFHIGASALIYALSSFLFFSGVLRRDRRSIGAAMITALLFGASVWGVFPFQVGISWEGHLFGAIAGAIFALVYFRVDLPARYIEEEEEPEPAHEQPDRREDDDDYYANTIIVDGFEEDWWEAQMQEPRKRWNGVTPRRITVRRQEKS